MLTVFLPVCVAWLLLVFYQYAWPFCLFSTSVHGLPAACFLPVCMAWLLPVFYQCTWPDCCLFSASVHGLTAACCLPVCMAWLLPVFYHCAWPDSWLFSTSVHGLTAACGLRLCQGCNNTCRASLLLSGIHCIAAHNRTARKILLKNLLNFLREMFK